MAGPTQIAFGDGNRGFQVGLNTGSITTAFHLPPEQPETPPKPCLTIPFRRDANFVPRKSLLDRIYHACSRPASRIALVGLGGIGKSQLAIEYAYRTSDEAAKTNHPTWVFWIHAETRARVEEGFRYIADTVKIPGRKQTDANVLQLVEQWLRSIENGPWLLILDNADNGSVLFDADPELPDKANATTSNDASRRALWSYLPQSAHGSTIVTTRNKGVAQKLVDDYKSIIEVHPMDEDHALALLERKAGSQPNMENGTASERHKLSLLNRDEGDLRRDREASNSIIVTWQISFESIRSERPSAADLLALMSFFDHQAIPQSLIQPCDRPLSRNGNMSEGDDDRTDEESDTDSGSWHDHDSDDSRASNTSEDSTGQAFEDDLLLLRNYSLISIDETGAIFGMHSLVQLATSRWLSAEKRTAPLIEEFVHRMARGFPSGEYTLFAHVESAIKHRPESGKPLEEWAQILFNGSCQGRYGLAETMAKRSRDARIEALGKDHELTWKSVSVIGEIFHDQGKYRKAEELFMEVIETSKQKLGLDHPDTLASIHNLASTYCNQGRWDQAEELEVEVMETRKQKLGLDHPDTLASMANLAATYWNQGRWDQAEKLELEVMETSKQRLGLNHPDTLTSMADLARTLYAQKRAIEAIDLMDSCHERRGHPHTSSSLKYLKTWRTEQMILPLSALNLSEK
ncbi:P-loop containing nucleoside triphosphate hydrolase protein [Microdochium trichocladiopsis]|uniref:P-loop containing nucleoside triphosphate hydrolase protein n=1 Tax=Microdochium trichocladiopsis TaxID=1682393 RepID=A0A9P8XSH2_9PEZI|nr:P-loop containing nucleoside triphosphate hydrolase protein [Microdochium trichocladiopsis]KAH7009249.1 P-loop containing nucleoside triphosphate hydrolase protein [Microdochium trichocladiopsis]